MQAPKYYYEYEANQNREILHVPSHPLGIITSLGVLSYDFDTLLLQRPPQKRLDYEKLREVFKPLADELHKVVLGK